LKDGIAPFPFVTRSTTSESGGFASSRFGPTVPVAPASFNVWQLAQPAPPVKMASPGSASEEVVAAAAVVVEAVVVALDDPWCLPTTQPAANATPASATATITMPASAATSRTSAFF